MELGIGEAWGTGGELFLGVSILGTAFEFLRLKYIVGNESYSIKKQGERVSQILSTSRIALARVVRLRR